MDYLDRSFTEELGKTWMKKLTELGVVWKHDGKRHRPYARLTSGKISDGYANCTPLVEHPSELMSAANDLARMLPRVCFRTEKLIAVGQAMGSITIASAIATHLKCRFWYTVKSPDGMKLDSRFQPEGDECAFPVEDVMTTGMTSLKTRDALVRRNVTHPVPFVATIVDRTDLNARLDFPIVSLVRFQAQVWEEGNNPFTKDGKEIVEPVRPKQNWEELTRAY